MLHVFKFDRLIIIYYYKRKSNISYYIICNKRLKKKKLRFPIRIGKRYVCKLPFGSDVNLLKSAASVRQCHWLLTSTSAGISATRHLPTYTALLLSINL